MRRGGHAAIRAGAPPRSAEVEDDPGQLLGDAPQASRRLPGPSRPSWSRPPGGAPRLEGPVGADEGRPGGRERSRRRARAAPSSLLCPTSLFVTFIARLLAAAGDPSTKPGPAACRSVAGSRGGPPCSPAAPPRPRRGARARGEEEVGELRLPVGGQRNSAARRSGRRSRSARSGGGAGNRDDAGAPPEADRQQGAVRAKWPRWLVPNWSSNPSSVVRRGVAITPALLTSRSIGRARRSAARRARGQMPGREVERGQVEPAPGAAERTLQAPRPAGGVTAGHHDGAGAGQPGAVNSPMPLLAPVTTATRPPWSGMSEVRQACSRHKLGPGLGACGQSGPRPSIICSIASSSAWSCSRTPRSSRIASASADMGPSSSSASAR